MNGKNKGFWVIRGEKFKRGAKLGLSRSEGKNPHIN